MIDPQLAKEGVAERVSCRVHRDIESLPVPVLWGRERMGESTWQALGRTCRDLDGLFESLLAQNIDDIYQ